MTIRMEALLTRIDHRLGSSESALPLLSVSQTRGVLRHSDLHERPARADSFETYKLVKKGDVVFNEMSIRSGALGIAQEPGFVTYHYEVMRPRRGCDGRFAVYLMKSDWFTSELIRNERGIGAGGAAGVRTTEVPFSVLRTIRVPAWTAQQQRQIADYLDHETAEIDAFIADLELFRRLEQERLDATVDLAFHSPGARLVPFKRLGLVQSAGVSVNAASWPAEDGVPGVLKTGSVSKGFFDPSESKAVLDDVEISRLACPVVADSIVVNRANTPDLVGRAAYVATEHPGLYLSDLLWRIRFAHGLTEYVGAWMSTRAYQNAIQAIRVGASSTMQKISFERFSGIALPLPDELERRSAVDRVNRVAASRVAMKAEVDAAVGLAKERRVALITAAVTGQIDLAAKQKPTVDSMQTAIEESR